MYINFNFLNSITKINESLKKILVYKYYECYSNII